MNKINDITELVNKLLSNHNDIERLLDMLDKYILQNDVGTAAIKQFIDMCKQHNRLEENIMVMINYSKINEHINDHRKIIRTLTKSIEMTTIDNKYYWCSVARDIRVVYYDHIAHYDDPLFDVLRNALDPEFSKRE